MAHALHFGWEWYSFRKEYSSSVSCINALHSEAPMSWSKGPSHRYFAACVLSWGRSNDFQRVWETKDAEIDACKISFTLFLLLPCLIRMVLTIRIFQRSGPSQSPGTIRGLHIATKLRNKWQMYGIGVCFSIFTDKSIGGYFVRCKCLTDMDQAQ